MAGLHVNPVSYLLQVGQNVRANGFFFQAEDGIRDDLVTGVQTCALPISHGAGGRLVQRLANVLPTSGGDALPSRREGRQGIADDGLRAAPGRRGPSLPALTMRTGVIAKRAFDVAVALPALLLLARVLLLTALAVRVSMGSRVLFRHRRPGYRRRPFRAPTLHTSRPGP